MLAKSLKPFYGCLLWHWHCTQCVLHAAATLLLTDRKAGGKGGRNERYGGQSENYSGQGLPHLLGGGWQSFPKLWGGHSPHTREKERKDFAGALKCWAGATPAQRKIKGKSFLGGQAGEPPARGGVHLDPTAAGGGVRIKKVGPPEFATPGLR